MVEQSRLQRFFGGQNNAAPGFPNGLMEMNAVRRSSSQVLGVPYCQQSEDDYTGQPVRYRSWRPDMQLACEETNLAGYPNGADHQGTSELANGERYPIQESNPFQGRNRAVENACRCTALPQLPINRQVSICRVSLPVANDFSFWHS